MSLDCSNWNIPGLLACTTWSLLDIPSGLLCSASGGYVGIQLRLWNAPLCRGFDATKDKASARAEIYAGCSRAKVSMSQAFWTHRTRARAAFTASSGSAGNWFTCHQMERYIAGALSLSALAFATYSATHATSWHSHDARATVPSCAISRAVHPRTRQSLRPVHRPGLPHGVERNGG